MAVNSLLIILNFKPLFVSFLNQEDSIIRLANVAGDFFTLKILAMHANHSIK